MNDLPVTRTSVPKFDLWRKISNKRVPISFDLEITSRCSNNCRHCYINLPPGDNEAKSGELSLVELENIADQAVELGALWCLISGGEPLLREDFSDIYIMLKRKGLLLTVFTSACLINEEHIKLFKKFPPREIEVTVYGVTEETYEKVSRVKGSYMRFRHGLDLLINGGIKVRLKAMALRSNLHEHNDIGAFCRERTKDYYKYDPMLQLRYDRDPFRNEEIKSERLTPEEIVKLEQEDPERSASIDDHCDQFIFEAGEHRNCNHLFHCGAGQSSFTVSPDGIFRLCPSLWHPDMIYDLKKGSLRDAWEKFVPKVLDAKSDNPEFHSKCHSCEIVNLCSWCPAIAYLETGSPDKWVDSFCQVAHARKSGIENKTGK